MINTQYSNNQTKPFWLLIIGDWNLFGNWDLEIGI